jgi:hypothetical protein
MKKESQHLDPTGGAVGQADPTPAPAPAAAPKVAHKSKAKDD